MVDSTIILQYLCVALHRPSFLLGECRWVSGREARRAFFLVSRSLPAVSMAHHSSLLMLLLLLVRWSACLAQTSPTVLWPGEVVITSYNATDGANDARNLSGQVGSCRSGYIPRFRVDTYQQNNCLDCQLFII